MPSFDIVSEIDAAEVKNAVDNATRELSTRFDFRGVEASFSFKDLTVTMKSESEFQVQQLEDILRKALAKRGVEAGAMKLDAKHALSGKTVSRGVSFKQGIEQDIAKKITKGIKENKLKVQASIQGDKVRVTGKKRDDLQTSMAFVRNLELDQPVQFDNFRD